MEPSTGVKPWQWVVTILVIIVVLVLGGYMIFGNKASTTENPTPIDMTTNEQTNIPTSNRIVVSDQFPGNIVYVTTVSLMQPGFVEIHKSTNGKPGAIIGSQYFEAGTRPGNINLTENTVDGSTYYAMLHLDDGDKKFDPAKDLPIKDNAGNIIMQAFKANKNLPESKG